MCLRYLYQGRETTHVTMSGTVHQDGDNCIPIRYRFDGKLFNLRRLQAKVQTEVYTSSSLL